MSGRSANRTCEPHPIIQCRGWSPQWMSVVIAIGAQARIATGTAIYASDPFKPVYNIVTKVHCFQCFSSSADYASSYYCENTVASTNLGGFSAGYASHSTCLVLQIGCKFRPIPAQNTHHEFPTSRVTSKYCLRCRGHRHYHHCHRETLSRFQCELSLHQKYLFPV